MKKISLNNICFLIQKLLYLYVSNFVFIFLPQRKWISLASQIIRYYIFKIWVNITLSPNTNNYWITVTELLYLVRQWDTIFTDRLTNVMNIFFLNIFLDISKMIAYSNLSKIRYRDFRVNYSLMTYTIIFL